MADRAQGDLDIYPDALQSRVRDLDRRRGEFFSRWEGDRARRTGGDRATLAVLGFGAILAGGLIYYGWFRGLRQDLAAQESYVHPRLR